MFFFGFTDMTPVQSAFHHPQGVHISPSRDCMWMDDPLLQEVVSSVTVSRCSSWRFKGKCPCVLYVSVSKHILSWLAMRYGCSQFDVASARGWGHIGRLILSTKQLRQFHLKQRMNITELGADMIRYVSSMSKLVRMDVAHVRCGGLLPSSLP